MLDESDWHTHLSITGHVEQMREDTDLAGIDRLARQYAGQPYPGSTAAGSAPPGSPWTAGTAGARSRTAASQAE